MVVTHLADCIVYMREKIIQRVPDEEQLVDTYCSYRPSFFDLLRMEHVWRHSYYADISIMHCLITKFPSKGMNTKLKIQFCSLLRNHQFHSV